MKTARTIVPTLLLLCLSIGHAYGQQTPPPPGPVFPSFAGLVARVGPAVVNISTVTSNRDQGAPFHFFFGENDGQFRDFFRKWFGEVPERRRPQKSLGSGFIIDPSGLILTNYHVVQNAEEITVRLSDQREFKATVAGRDEKTDIALVTITSPPPNLPVLTLGDSDRMQVGDWVLAIGNPFGFSHTVTHGIISATGRVIGLGPYDHFLQTDAPVNPGNSGGPLINMAGEVIGVTTAIFASGQSIGFAIPSTMAKTVVGQLREKGRVVRGYIGVFIQEVTPDLAKTLGLKEATGALIGDVVPGGPSDKAGFLRGDVIMVFDGKPVKNYSDLPLIVAATPVGSSVQVTLIRDGKTLVKEITIAELKDDAAKTEQPEDKGGLLQKRLGLTLSDITPALQRKFQLKEMSGVVVTGVRPGGPAAKAGIRQGDQIVEVNRRAVAAIDDFILAIQKSEDKPVLVLVRRGKVQRYTTIEPEVTKPSG